MKINKACRVIHNNDKTIIANICTGEWILIPSSCWEVLQIMNSNNLSIREVCELAADEEDNIYLSNVLQKLSETEFIVTDVEENIKINKVYFNMTYRCNLSCRHCCVDARPVADFSIADETDTEGVKKIIDKIININPEEVVLSGGEPLIRSDFIEVLEYLRVNFHNKIFLSTNATLICKANVDVLCQYIDRFDISIDGIDEISCSKVRGKGTFGKVIQSINLLKEHGGNDIYLSMMFGDFNENLRTNFLELCSKLGVKPLMRAFEPMGRGSLNQREFENLNMYTTQQHIYTENELREARMEMCCFNCGAGKTEIMISPLGEIYPCGNLKEKDFCLGNVLEIGDINCYLRESWKRKEKNIGCDNLEKAMPFNFERCKDCKVNLFCWSCISGVRNRYRNRQQFEVECKEKYRELCQIVWGEVTE